MGCAGFRDLTPTTSASPLLHCASSRRLSAHALKHLLSSAASSDKFHDRFLIIDKATLIHVGASLNHLGKKCVAFSSLDKSNIPDILAKL